MAFGHGELAFQRDDFGGPGRADDVPERGLAGGGGDADAGGAAIDVVGDVDGFRVAGEGFDAAQFGLGEERMVGESLGFEESFQSAGAAAESEGVDGQHGVVRIGLVALVAGGFEAALQRLAHDHPQGVAGGDVVAAGEHELVAEGMLGAAIVVAQATELGSGEVRGDVEGRVGEGSAEVPGLRVVAEQHQGHAGHVPDVFETFPAERHVQRFNRRK